MRKEPLMTHSGVVLITSWNGKTFSQQIQLRETPKLWITQHGERFPKAKEVDGSIELRKGDTWNRYSSWLQLESIRQLTPDEQRKPLVARVAMTTRICDEAREQLDKATADLARAQEAHKEAVATLAAFDAKKS